MHYKKRERTGEERIGEEKIELSLLAKICSFTMAG